MNCLLIKYKQYLYSFSNMSYDTLYRIREMLIIKNEEQRTNGCSSVSVKSFSGYPRKLLSLGRVAGVFFIAIRFLMRASDHDGNRELPHVKRNPQRPIPPFGTGSRNSRQPRCVFVPLTGQGNCISSADCFQLSPCCSDVCFFNG